MLRRKAASNVLGNTKLYGFLYAAETVFIPYRITEDDRGLYAQNFVSLTYHSGMSCRGRMKNQSGQSVRILPVSIGNWYPGGLAVGALAQAVSAFLSYRCLAEDPCMPPRSLTSQALPL